MMKKGKLLLPLLSLFVLGGCEFPFFGPKNEPGNNNGQDIVDDTPSVTSVSISGSKATLALGTTLTLTANVQVKNGASKTVSWSSSATAVATVSSSGLVTPVSVGTVTIKATSTFDQTKFAEVTISVVDQGFMPELVEEGYEYSKTFPSSKLATYVGTTVAAFENYGGGYYYAEVTPEGYAPYAEIIIDYTQAALDAVYAAFADFGYYYYSSYYMEYEAFIDPTINYEADLGVIYDDYYNEIAFYVDFYKVEDVFDGSKVATEDIAWSEETALLLEEYGVELPFVALGADYIAEEGDEMIYIYDYSANFKLLEGVGDILQGAGFVSKNFGTEEEPYLLWVKDIDDYNIAVVDVYFCEYGNEIDVWTAPKELEEFPSDELNAFTDETLKCANQVPAFVTEEATFTWQPGLYNVSETVEDIREATMVGILGATEEEVETYNALLASNGFVPDTENSYEKEEGYSCYMFQKGRLCVDVNVVYGFREPTEEELDWAFGLEEEDIYALSDSDYDKYLDIAYWYLGYGDGILDYETIQQVGLLVYADPAINEQPGLYLDEIVRYAYVDDTFKFEPTVYLLDSPVISFASSDEEVATVDAEGNVTVIAAGTAEITASCTVSEKDYSVTLTLVSSINYKVNEILELYEYEFEFDVVEPEDFEFYSKYFDSYSESLQIAGTSTQSAEEYMAALVEKGFEAGVDSYGYDIVHDSNYAIFVFESQGYLVIEVSEYVALPDGTSIDFSVGGLAVSGSANGFNYSAAKGSGSSDPATCSKESDFKELRLYDKNTLTISSETTITSIEIVCNTCTCSKSGAKLTCSTGSLQETATGYMWTGSATEVTFTCVRVGSGDAGKQCHITLININGGGEGGGGTVVADAEEEFIQELICLIFDQDTAEFGVDYWDDDGLFTAFQGESLTDTIDELYALLSQVYECEQYNEDGYYGFYVDSLDGSCYADVYSYEHPTLGVVIEIDVYSYDF